MKTPIRIATRTSKLALWQSSFVQSAIENHYPDCDVTFIEIVTEGDRFQTAPLSTVGGKSNFVKALQDALLRNEADIAVHSMKDMSAHETPDLVLAAVCERSEARDAFVSNHYADIAALPSQAIIGTASSRRECILKSLRPDITVKLLRGNVETRIIKLDNHDYDAVILAAAGLTRLGLAHRIRDYLSGTVFIPAIAQGAIGIECRANDAKTREMMHFLNHTPSALCVNAERRVNQILGGDCHAAIGAYATIYQDQLYLSAFVGKIDGTELIRVRNYGALEHALCIATEVANTLIRYGAKDILRM